MMELVMMPIINIAVVVRCNSLEVTVKQKYFHVCPIHVPTMLLVRRSLTLIILVIAMMVLLVKTVKGR
jgi:hypothetical protein